MTKEDKKFSSVPVDWEEVYTNCPLVSTSNIDQELGWTREEYKKSASSTRSCAPAARTTGTPPHYIYNMENLIHFGGLMRRSSTVGTPVQ